MDCFGQARHHCTQRGCECVGFVNQFDALDAEEREAIGRTAYITCQRKSEIMLWCSVCSHPAWDHSVASRESRASSADLAEQLAARAVAAHPRADPHLLRFLAPELTESADAEAGLGRLRALPAAAALRLEPLGALFDAGRAALLAELKRAGVERLADRQLVANAVGRFKREAEHAWPPIMPMPPARLRLPPGSRVPGVGPTTVEPPSQSRGANLGSLRVHHLSFQRAEPRRQRVSESALHDIQSSRHILLASRASRVPSRLGAAQPQRSEHAARALSRYRRAQAGWRLPAYTRVVGRQKSSALWPLARSIGAGPRARRFRSLPSHIWSSCRAPPMAMRNRMGLRFRGPDRISVRIRKNGEWRSAVSAGFRLCVWGGG